MTTDKAVYDERRRFYESLGFALTARKDYHVHKNCDHYVFDVDMSASFLFEAYLAAISVLTALYYWVNARRIDYLTDPYNQLAIQEYKDLVDPTIDPLKATVEEQTKEERLEIKRKEATDAKRLAQLEKSIKKNFIDAEYFYQYN